MSDATRTTTAPAVTTVTCGKASPSPRTVTPGAPMTVTPVTRPAVTNGATTRREVAPRRHGQWTVTPPVTVTRDLVAFGTNPPGGPPPLPKPPAKGLRTTAFGLFAVMTIAGGGVVGATGSGSDLRWALIALTLFAAVGSAGTAIAANTR